MALTYLSAPARAGLWVCPNQAVCQSTDHKGWVLTVDKMSPKCVPHLLQHFHEHPLERRMIALKLRIWPRAWSVLVSLLCYSAYKNNADLQSLWVMSSASFPRERALPMRPTAAALQSLLEGLGAPGK